MSAPTALLTPRLRLEAFGPEHGELLADLAARPEVVRFIGDGSVWSRQRACEVAARHRSHWREYGFGWRTAVELATEQPVGFAALNMTIEGSGVGSGEYEIGWWLAPEAQGRGLGREGARAVRDEAFERLEAPSIVARIQPANDASLALARAIGLRPDRRGRVQGGQPIAVLRLTAQAWQAGRRTTRA